jgi:hypothetical protein
MNGEVHLNLWASINDGGDFSIEGQDLGPRDEEGDLAEYEWTTTVTREHVPALIQLLGGTPGDDVLQIVKRDWVRIEGQGLEQLIRESDVPCMTEVHVR